MVDIINDLKKNNNSKAGKWSPENSLRLIETTVKNIIVLLSTYFIVSVSNNNIVDVKLAIVLGGYIGFYVLVSVLMEYMHPKR